MRNLSFPINSWVELPRIYNISTSMAFHFPLYRNFSCRLPISTGFSSVKYHILGTSHPRQWPLAYLRYLISNPSSLNSILLDLTQLETADRRLRLHAQLSPRSPHLTFMASA